MPRNADNSKAAPTKAERIRADLERGCDYAVIATTVGVSRDYVRAIANREKNKFLYGRSMSPTEMDSHRRRRATAEGRARAAAYARRYRAAAYKKAEARS